VFDVLMNGTGDAFTATRYGTNFICEADGFRLAVDCPDSYRRSLNENQWGFDVDGIDAFFITHLHGDHVNGLEMVLAFSSFALSKKLELFTTPNVAKALWDRRLACSIGTMWDGEHHNSLKLSDFANLHEVGWGVPTSVGPFEIETRKTVHHIPTAGFRLSHGGAVLGYACDTAFDRGYVDWLSAESGLILHETSFGPAHTPLESLESLPEDIRERMRVVHYPDGVEEPETLTFARQGERYSVRPLGEPATI
jgi:ribonuclease BN (tRNA processing enzyme)